MAPPSDPRSPPADWDGCAVHRWVTSGRRSNPWVAAATARTLARVDGDQARGQRDRSAGRAPAQKEDAVVIAVVGLVGPSHRRDRVDDRLARPQELAVPQRLGQRRRLEEALEVAPLSDGEPGV